jgi:hypothetical protein
MNLFVLDLDPSRAAEQNCDKHVCKIILEAADCLCLAHWESGGLPSNAPEILSTPRTRVDKRGRTRTIYSYRAQSQVNNHVAIWVRTTLGNYRWTAEHGLALGREYSRRYGKVHATHDILRWLAENEPDLPSGSTPFRQAVADDPVNCKRADVVLAYKLYYCYYKHGFAKWRDGNAPQWYTDMRQLIDRGYSVSQVESAA